MMSMPLSQLIASLVPKHTVLVFGAGSSLPSGAPPVHKIIEHLANAFSLDTGFSLSEIASLAERKTSRKHVITELRKLLANLRPQGGLRNLPLYDWKSIYTTNYDDLVEQVYQAHGKACRVYSSNFDFTIRNDEPDCNLFKIHGTIEKDISDGNNSRVIITEADYEQTEVYREFIYDRLKGDLAGANLIIIGQSLSDQGMFGHDHWTRERDDRIMQEYGLPPGPHPDYEIDHLIPLDLGGADEDKNLWPEPRRSIEPVWNAERKDRLEWRMAELVCSGRLDLPTAQKEISSDWTLAFRKYVGEPR